MAGSPLEWLVGGRVVSHFSRTAMFSGRAVPHASSIQMQRIVGSSTYSLIHHTRCHQRPVTSTPSDTGAIFTARTYLSYRVKRGRNRWSFFSNANASSKFETTTRSTVRIDFVLTKFLERLTNLSSSTYYNVNPEFLYYSWVLSNGIL